MSTADTIATVPVNAIAHIDGYDVRVESLQLARTGAGDRVDAVATLRLSTTGPDDAFLTPVRLEWPGSTRAPAPAEVPPVAAGETVEHAVVFEAVGWTSPPPGAAIVLGEEPYHQARLPLDGSPARTLAPVTIQLDAGATVGNLLVVATTITTRADDPRTHTTLPADQALVRIDLRARLVADGAPNLLGRHLRLRLGESSVGVRADGWSAPNLILSGEPQPAAARFDVPIEALGGEATLVIDGPFASDAERAVGEIALTLPAL